MNRYFGDLAQDVGCEYNWSIYMDTLLQHAFHKTPHHSPKLRYRGSLSRCSKRIHTKLQDMYLQWERAVPGTARLEFLSYRVARRFSAAE